VSDQPYPDDPYPFESDDDIEIRELDLEDLDAVADARITVGELASATESWRYGHVIVDEAQDLTPMQWRMVMRRVRGRSLTIVGDLAQRSASTAERWEDLLPDELVDARRQDLTVNYRSPAEIHALAVEVLADFAPSVAPSIALRFSGWEPEFRQVRSLDAELDTMIASVLGSVGGLVAVIAADPRSFDSTHRDDEIAESRVRFLTPNQTKGLEFDAVVLVEPADIWHNAGGAAQLYIALTRATQRLTVVHEGALPPPLTNT
jgi:DNA helicase IV